MINWQLKSNVNKNKVMHMGKKIALATDIQECALI